MTEKWIAVIGSPRRYKNTETLVDLIIKHLAEKDIAVEKLILDCHNISTCTGCEGCIKTGNCIIHDNISGIIDKMKTADGYIFASPSYNYNVTSQMKALLDRTFCLNDYSDGCKSRLSPNRKAIITGVCRGKSKESMGFTVKGMSRVLSELDVNILTTIEYYDTKNLPVYENPDIEKAINERLQSL